MVALGVLLLALAGGIFALVEDDFRNQRRALPESPVDWNSVIDDPDEPLTITWLGARFFSSSREGTWIERMLEEFDSFVEEWRTSGGDQLIAEARELYPVKQDIYEKVGAVRK